MNKEEDPGPSEETPRRIPIRDKRRVRLDAEPDGTEEGLGPAPVEATGPDPDQQVAKAEALAAERLADLQRLQAEFENYRKRIIKEQSALVERASAVLIRRLLGVLDNFELAVAAAEDTRGFDRMLKGVEMVFGELKEVLAQEGLEPIIAKGRPFDPNLHEAALEVGGGDSPEPRVVEVLRPGYLFKGSVLRPAMVKVARAKEETSPEVELDEEEGHEK